MAFTLPRPKVAYIGLSLELYLKSGSQLDRWQAAFDNWSSKLAGFADICCRKLCYTDAEIAEVTENIRKSDAEVIVLSAVSYTPSMLIMPLLKSIDLPVVIWSTQDSAIIRENYEPVDLTLNHTVQGIQDITNVMFQNGMKFSIVTGHWEDEETLSRLNSELVAARAANAAKNIRVLALGGAFAGMGDFEFEPNRLRAEWGPQAVNIEADEFLAAVSKVDEEAVEAIRLADMEKFQVLDSLQPETHKESIRRKLAVSALLEQYDANAFTMNFTRLTYAGFGQLPFYAINCLMAEGIGYAGEGDILRAAAMRQLIELTGDANFSEIYTVDFKRDLFFMSHMQECSIGIARKDRKVVLKSMPFWVEGVPDYTGMFFTAEPGDYTLVCITPDCGSGYRMIAFPGNVPDLPVIETYNRAYWLLKPQLSAEETLDKYSIYGGAHHLSVVRGNRMADLKRLAYQLGFKFSAIV
ncbi:MAG: hypothetical protein E7057_08110 [Lentisphaerae bacterium]|nr:hypothetical protein [Lentisphaerota bacterium]